MEALNRAMLSKHGGYGEGNAPVDFLNTISVAEGLPRNFGGGSASKEPKRYLLTFIQGFRQTIEYALQAKLLSLESHEASLVADSDLLLHSNNAAHSTTMLLRFLVRYPHRRRVLVQSTDNSQGYRCGHLAAIAGTRSAWSVYANVLFLHPDVYLLPRAVRWLETALQAAETRKSAFVVTRMYWPDPSHPSHRLPPLQRIAFFGTDLFAFRPSLVPADAWAKVCQLPASGSKLPEHGLWRLVTTSYKLPHIVLGNRTTANPWNKEDAYGVWHSHGPEVVVKYIERMQNRT